MIVVVEYGMSNLKSIINAFSRLHADIVISSDLDTIGDAPVIVLPGVGSFGTCMENLSKKGLDGAIKEHIKNGKRYLGICLGMQILFESSEETPGIPGLGIIKGTVSRFTSSMKIPHMGWNRVALEKDSPVFTGLKSEDFFYFVHSFYCVPDDRHVIATTTDYGAPFVSSVEMGSLFACQFHPEKSQAVGLKLLRNFLDIAKNTGE